MKIKDIIKNHSVIITGLNAKLLYTGLRTTKTNIYYYNEKNKIEKIGCYSYNENGRTMIYENHIKEQ